MTEQDLRLSDQVSQYVDKHSLRESKHLCQLRHKTCQDVEFPHMLSAPASMQFIQLLLQLMQAEQVLELGVYTGYSTLAMAEVLPQNGRVVALDHSTVWPEVGKPFWQQAGVADKIDLRIGNATECLQALVEQQNETIGQLRGQVANALAWTCVPAQCSPCLDACAPVFDPGAKDWQSDCHSAGESSTSEPSSLAGEALLWLAMTVFLMKAMARSCLSGASI